MMQNICKNFLVVLMFGLIHVDALSMNERNDSLNDPLISLKKQRGKNFKKKNKKAHNINRNDEKYSFKSDILQFIEEKESLENFEKEHDKTLKILDILTNVRDEIEKKELEIKKADIDNNCTDINNNKNHSWKINKCENKDINTIKLFNSILNEEIKKNTELENVKKELIKKELKCAINKYNDFYQEKSEIENIENEIKKDIKKNKEIVIDEGIKLEEEIRQCKEEEIRQCKEEEIEQYKEEELVFAASLEHLLKEKEDEVVNLEWESSRADANLKKIRNTNAKIGEIEENIKKIQQMKEEREEKKTQLDRKKRQEFLEKNEKKYNDLNEKMKKIKEVEEKIKDIESQYKLPKEKEFSEIERNTKELGKNKKVKKTKKKEELNNLEQQYNLLKKEIATISKQPIKSNEKTFLPENNNKVKILKEKKIELRAIEGKIEEAKTEEILGELEERETELAKLSTEKEKLDKELKKVEKRIEILSPSDEDLQTAFKEIKDIKRKQIEEGRDVNEIDEGIKNKIKGMVKNSRQENKNKGEVLLQELRTNIQALDKYIKHNTDTNDYKKGYKMTIREKEPEKEKDGYGVRKYIKSGMDNLTRMIEKATNEQQINKEKKEKILKEIEKIQNTAIDFNPTTSFEQKKEESDGEEKINEEKKDREIIETNEDIKEDLSYEIRQKKEKEDEEKLESFEDISASLEKIKNIYSNQNKVSNKSVDVLDEKVMEKAQKLIESEENVLKGQKTKDKILTKIDKIKDFVNDLSKKNEEKKKEKKIKEKEDSKDKKGEEKKHLIDLFSAEEQRLIASEKRGPLEFNDETCALQQIKENNNIDNIKLDLNDKSIQIKENNNIDNIDNIIDFNDDEDSNKLQNKENNNINSIDLNSDSQKEEINSIEKEKLVDENSLSNGDTEENLLNNSTSTWHSDNDQSIAGYLKSEEYKDLKNLVINEENQEKEINTEKKRNKIDKKKTEKVKSLKKEDIINTFSPKKNLEEKNDKKNEVKIINKKNSIIEEEEYINKESHQKQQHDAASLLKKGLHLNKIAKIKGCYDGQKQFLVYKEERLKKRFSQDISPKKNISPDNVIGNNKVEEKEIAEYKNKLKLLNEEDSKFSSLIFFRVLGRFALSFLFSAVNSVMQFERKDVIGPYFSIYTLSFGKITQPSFLRKNIYIDISLSLLSFLIFTAFDQKIQNEYRAYVKDHSLCKFLSLIKYTTNAFNININLFVNKDFYISFNIMSIFDSLLNLVWKETTQIKKEIKCKIKEMKINISIERINADKNYKIGVDKKTKKLKNILKPNIAFYKWNFLRRMFIYGQRR